MSQAIFSKIPKIMAEVGAVEKGRKNQAQNYQFRGIDDFYAALQPVLSKHGVFCAPTVLRETREERQTKSGGTMIYTVLAVEFAFYAEDGSSFKAVTVGEAMDSGDKSSNKAMSAALKYLFMQVFCIPTEEDKDTENHGDEFTPRAPNYSWPQSGPVLKEAPAADPGATTVPFEKSSQFGTRIDALSEKELRDMGNFLSKLKPPMKPETAQFKQDFEAYVQERFGAVR